jgi:hypothetical protein
VSDLDAPPEVPPTETFDWLGGTFHVAPSIGLMPMLRFANVAKSGIDSKELEAMFAMHELLRNTIHPDDWERFQIHAADNYADGDELMEVVAKVMAIVGDRPTGRSSDSSAGPRTIEPSSTVVSSSPAMDNVIDMYNAKGRPDLALMVRRRQESLTG